MCVWKIQLFFDDDNVVNAKPKVGRITSSFNMIVQWEIARFQWKVLLSSFMRESKKGKENVAVENENFYRRKTELKIIKRVYMATVLVGAIFFQI